MLPYSLDLIILPFQTLIWPPFNFINFFPFFHLFHFEEIDELDLYL